MSFLLSFLIALIIYSQAYFYLWSARIVDIMPGLWLAVVAFLGLTASVFSFRRHSEIGAYHDDIQRNNRLVLAVWALVFGVVASLSFVASAQLPEELRALKTVIITLGMLCTYLLAFNGPREIKAARVAIVLTVLIAIANNLAEVLGIYSFSVAEGRGSGFYINPNISALYLLIGMIVTVSMLPARFRLTYCFAVGIGVAATFSRAGGLVWLLSVYGLGQAKLFRMSRISLTALIASMLTVLLIMQLGNNWVTRLGFVNHLSENATLRLHLEAESDDSIQGRMEVALRSLKLIEESPWVGHGLGAHSVGSTTVWPHNTYLLMGVEMGILGIAIYLWLLVILWRMKSPMSKVFAVALGAWSLFDHNVLEHPGMWLAYVVLAGLAGSRELSHGVEADRMSPTPPQPAKFPNLWPLQTPPPEL